MTAAELAAALGSAKRIGADWYALCPAHDDRVPSLAITERDGRLLVNCRAGCEQEAVIAALKARGLWQSGGTVRAVRVPVPTITYTPIAPVPDDAPLPVFHHARLGDPVRTWAYRAPGGAVLCYVARFETKTKSGKQILPLTWCRSSDGRTGWRWQALPKPRPLYGLDRLALRLTAQVLIVEGEKCADAAIGLLPMFVTVTWPGGAAGVKHANWSPLADRRCTIWPDSDDPGRKAAQDILAIVPHARIVPPPADMPPGWDIADAVAEGWTTQQARAHLRWAGTPNDPPESDAPLEANKANVLDLIPRPAMPQAQQSDWSTFGLLTNSRSKPFAILANALHAIREAPPLKGAIAFDTFSQRLVVLKRTPWGTKPGAIWSDRDDALFADWLQHCEIRVGVDTAREAAMAVAHDRTIDTLQAYLTRLVWDGKRRIGAMHAYFGYRIGGITDDLFRLWCISAVARGMNPGVKADHVIVLEGPQGARKSSALRIMFDPKDRGWFRDELPSLNDKDSAIQLQGAWCVEISELDAVNARRTDLERVKAFLSRSVDSYRPPYGRHVVDNPRRCIFAGTTNDYGYLRDSTGNRRWWPVRCGLIDLKALASDRDQIWAEAMAALEHGDPWWPDETALGPLIEAEQEQRRTMDPWEDEIAYFCLRNPRTTIPEVLNNALKIEKGRWGQTEANRVSRILQRLGYIRRQLRQNNERVWFYERDHDDTSERD